MLDLPLQLGPSSVVLLREENSILGLSVPPHLSSLDMTTHRMVPMDIRCQI